MPDNKDIIKGKVIYDPIEQTKVAPTFGKSIELPDGFISEKLGNTDFGQSKYDDKSLDSEFIKSGDYKYIRGEQQNGFAQLGLGVLRAVAKAGVEVAKTPGYLYALGDATRSDVTLDQALDNAWLNGLESLDAKVKETLPVYQSYKSGKGGILDNIASTSFWASDGADGVGYLLGMMAPGAALKAVGMAGKLSKLGLGAKAAANVELGTQTVLNSSIESLAEAKGVADRLRKEGVDPEKIADAAFNTFMSNMGLLMAPNAIMNKNLLGRFTKDKHLLDNFRDPATGKLTSNPIIKKQLLKDYSKSIGTAAVSEGLVEEGGQTSIENYEVNKGLGKTNKGFIQGVAEEYINTLTTTEGQKAILLGSVLGTLGGAAGTYREGKSNKKQLPILANLIEKNFTGFSVDNDVYKRGDDGSISINPKTHQPELDVNKAKEAIQNFVSESKLAQEKDLAALANDKTLHDYIANEQFTRYAIPFIQQGEAGLQILNEHLDNVSNTQHLINEQSISQSKQLEFDENTYKTNLKNKAKELSKVYDSTLETIKGLDFLYEMKNVDPEIMDRHINKIANAIFQENSKQIFLKEAIRDLNTEANHLASSTTSDLPQTQLEIGKLQKEITGLSNLLEQSKEIYKSIFEPAQHEAALNKEVKAKKEEVKTEKAAEETTKTTEKEVPLNNEPVEVTNDDNELATHKEQLFDKVNSALDTEDLLTFSVLYNDIKKSSHLVDKKFIDALELKKQTLTNTPDVEDEDTNTITEVSNDQDIVSSNIQSTSTSDIEGTTQLNQDPNKIATEVENQKGIAYSNSYVAMKLFGNSFKDGVFKWLRNGEGFPEYVNNSGIDVKALNDIKAGDEVTLGYVTLNEAQQTEYLLSKKENGVYDGVHIGIYSNGNLIGFVPQAHGINPNSKNKELSQELFDDLIAYRKAVINKLEEGKSVIEIVTTKGNGNLYTKLTEKGNVDLVNNIFDTAREQDKLDGTLIFVYSNGQDLILPEESTISDESKNLIKDTLGNFKNYGKSGKMYQMVQDLTGSWAPIPVYANRMDKNSIKSIITILERFDNTSNPIEVVKALNDYVYASVSRDKADVFIRNLDNHLEFKVNGEWYSLDRLKTNEETITDFQTQLRSKRQNLNILKINNSYYQAEMVERGTLSTNVTTFNGEYFVQPYVEYSHSLIDNPNNYSTKDALNIDTNQANTSINNNADIATILKNNGISQSDLDKAIEGDDAFSTSKDLTKLDRKEFAKWLEKNLPQLTLSDVEQLQKIKDNSVDAFGMYRDSVIYLFEGAGGKTAYHEAFHGVFRNFLTLDQKFELIEEMMSKTNPPSDNDLFTLQDGLNRTYTKQELTYLFYEEKLADDFADFSQSYNTRTLSKKIKDFFMEILRFFKIVSTNDNTKLEELYKGINKGKFAKSTKVVEGIEVFNRPFENLNNDYAYNKKLDEAGFTPSNKQKYIESIGNQYLKIYQDTLLANKKPDRIVIFETIKGRYLEAFKKNINTDLKTAAWAQKIYNNFGEFTNEAKEFLAFRGINIKGEDIQFQGNLSEESLGDYEVETLKSRETKGFRDATTISGLNNASNRIKLFLSSIPVVDENNEPRKDMFDIQEYYDFNKLYYYIERNLTDVYTFEEQLNELKKLAISNPQIKQVVSLLEIKPSNMDDNTFEQIKNDFKTNFSKQQMAFTLVKYDTNSSTGEVKFRIMEANRQSIGRETLYTWEKNLEDDTRIGSITEFTKDGDIVKYGTKKAKDIYEQWQSLTKRKDPINYKVVSSILTKAGIEFTPTVLTSLVKANSNQFRDNVTNVLRYYAEPSDKTEAEGRKALSTLVSYEVDKMFESYTASFNNVENKVIYSIQLPSYASKILNKLRDRGVKFNNTLKDFQKDPFYKHSNILNELKFNRNLMKLSYIDGLKDEKGEAKGSKFTSMTPKDFLSMEIALFQNTYTNAGKEIKDNIHKYVYITPSDKTMGMIFDSKAYDVLLEANGRDIALNSEIIGKFYNVFLQEASRIKHNLDIKNDILTNKNSSKYTLDELLQYYHISKNNWSKFSSYANIQASGQELTEEQWNEISTMFDGQAYNWNYFSGSFNNNLKKLIGQTVLDSNLDNLEGNLERFRDDIVKGLRNELNKEFKHVKDELIAKGLIRFNTKTNLLENISLELKSTEATAVNDEINKLVAKYSLNSFLHNIEFSNILNGDVALYKAHDLQKRTYQSQAMTYNLNFKNKTIKTMVVKDVEAGSSEYDSIVSSLKKLGFNDSQIQEVAGKYKEGINVTDAQVYITPEFYKSIKVARGEWTSEMQEAFDIAEGKKTGSIPTAYHRLLGGIKPYYFGNRFDDKLGIQRYEQVKCAILPLFKTYTDINPLLAAKRQDMDNSGVDMMAHESSFKAAIGNRQAITGDVGVVVELEADNFGIQVDNPDHMDDGNDSMRQLKMLIIGSIDSQKTYKGVKGDSIISSIMNMEATNIKESFKELQEKMDFKNNLDFANFIKDMITKRGATMNIEEALSIVNGDFDYALDNGNLSTQIENMISSVYTNNVIKQKFAVGGSAVQASSIGLKYKNLAEQQEGLTEEAKLIQQELQWIKPTEDGIEYAECALPAWTKDFFDIKGKLKDINNIPNELKQLIAYRIPTEGLHSMMPIKVVKFLPETMGNFILLPYEVTTQLGADFDFDKIYFIGREYYKDTTDGTDVNLIPYTYVEGDDDAAVESRWKQYHKYTSLNNLPQKYESIEEFRTQPIELQNTRGSRNNKIVDNYLHLLTSLENLHLLITPSGFTTLEDFRDTYFLDRQKDNFFSSKTQRDYKERNHIGIALKGQSALHVSGHAYATLMNLSSEKFTKQGEVSKISAVNFNNTTKTNFSGLYTDNGKLIADELSSIMAAILDDIKNPLLEPLGINNNTIDVLATIIRSGTNMDTALKFIAQPSIKELSKYLSKNKDGIKEAGQGFYDINTLIGSEKKPGIYRQLLNKYLTRLKDTVDTDAIETSSHYLNLNDNELVTYLNFDTEGKTDLELAHYYAYQLRVLNNFSNISTIAKELVDINKFFGINKELGPNIEDIISKQDLYDNILASEVIKGFNIEKIPSLYQTFQVHKDALSWFENYFPYSSNVYMDIKKLTLSLQGTKKLSQTKVEDRIFMNNFIRAYSDMTSTTFGNVTNKYRHLFKNEPSLKGKDRTLVTLLKDIKNSSNAEEKLGNLTYAQIKNNSFINEIKLSFDKSNKLWFVTLKGNRLDLQVKNNIIQGFNTLYKNPNTKQLAIDLIEHSFVSSGFFSGLNSYANLISPEILKDLEYNQFRKTLIKDLKNNLVSLSTEQNNMLIDQMIRNNPKPFTKVFDDTMFGIKGTALPATISTSEAAIKEANRESNFLFTNPYGEIDSPKYIRVYDKAAKRSVLYKQAGHPLVFEKINGLGKKGFFLEIDPATDIVKSYLVDNNNTTKPAVPTAITEASENFEQETETPVLDTDTETPPTSNKYNITDDTEELGGDDIDNLPPIEPC